MRAGLAAFVLLFFVILALPLPAEAHAKYAFSTPPANGIVPSPPTSVSITFTEAVATEPGSPSVQVLNRSGERVESGPASVLPEDSKAVRVVLNEIGPDIYTVTWYVRSAVDGHSLRGSFSFAVQNPDGTIPGDLPGSDDPSGEAVSAVEVGGRFLSFLGLMIAFGVALLMVLAWLPGVRDAAAGTGIHGGGTGILAHWGRVGALTSALGVALWWSTVGLSLSGTLFNASLATRLVSALVLLGIFTLIAREQESPAEGRIPRTAWAAVVAGGFAVAGASIGTHAAADAGLLGAALHAVHLGCIAAWVGGLLSLFRLRPLLQATENVALARHVYGRFSKLAFYAVGGVLLAGTSLGLLLVETLDGLATSSYGWALLAKISLFVPLVALGAINRYRFLPAAAGSGDVPVKAIRSLTANVRREVALGAIVIAIAALLTSLVPPGTSAGGGLFQIEATTDGVRFDFSVDPFPRTPGVYLYAVQVWDATTSAPLDDARNATLKFTLLGSIPLVEQSLAMDGPHGNHFFSYTPVMSQAGTWKIDVLLSRWTALDVRVTFHIVAEAP